jgi:hypothetical protein
MASNVKPSERVALLGAINPQSAAAGTLTTGWIDVSKWGSVQAVLLAGALGASATVDAKFEQASAAGGTGAKDVTGYAITQLTKAGTDDNKQVIVNLPTEKLDINNGFRWVRLSVTVATAACLVSAIVQGFDGRFEPASDFDAATVDEIVG